MPKGVCIIFWATEQLLRRVLPGRCFPVPPTQAFDIELEPDVPNPSLGLPRLPLIAPVPRLVRHRTILAQKLVKDLAEQRDLIMALRSAADDILHQLRLVGCPELTGVHPSQTGARFCPSTA